MAEIDVKMHKLRQYVSSYYGGRIVGELIYGQQLSQILNGKYDDLLLQTADEVLKAAQTAECITEEISKKAEQKISIMQEEAKKFTMICVSHAHIDMNWMWRYDETVSISLDTFRTMLDLMNEYPDFTFSQSQASVYQIVEKYAADDMLKQIAQRVKEGRWEVTASTWVEADKNTPNAESMARHLLYTRRYLSDLLSMDGEKLTLDFEPDTFGHSENVPEILSKAGVKYYYHVRGSHDPALMWWKAPSGGKVLSYRDKLGYNAVVGYDFACNMLDSCREQGVDTSLRVYGVGDHGGGPSRRDIERIHDMMTWPVHPTIKFGTYAEFFHTIEDRFGDILPVRDSEMNAVFTGCYTTQTRIKLANRIGEATLAESELFSAFAGRDAGFRYPRARFADAWQKLLFNQFHDILTGSGVVDTREYAMGQFQQTMAIANTAKLAALRSLTAQIDTSEYIDIGPKDQYRTEGAGVGKGIEQFRISQTDRGCGKTRVYHFFNAAPFERTENVELTVWDWSNQELSLLEFRDAEGNRCPVTLLNSGTNWYWFHDFVQVLVKVTVPACGYATYTLSQSEDRVIPLVSGEPEEWQSVGVEHNYFLENNKIRAQFDLQSGALTSFIDKTTGEEMLPPGECGGFRLIDEDTERGMTAWRVGRHMNIRPFDSVHISPVRYSGDGLRQSIRLENKWGDNRLTVVVSLDDDSDTLQYYVECDWHEIGRNGERIPQLNFMVPMGKEIQAYKFDVPAGVIERAPTNLDLPGNSFIAAVPKNGKRGFMLSADTKYGFRGFDNSVAVDCIRGSFNPDPCPEQGIHHFQLALCPMDTDKNLPLTQRAFALWHPVNTLTEPAHKGTRGKSGSFLQLSGPATLQAVKMAENGDEIVVRIYETEGKRGTETLLFDKPVKLAAVCDIHEKKLLKKLTPADNKITVTMGKNELMTVRVKF